MMRYNLSCKPFDTQAYVSVLSAQGSLRIASASLWLDPFTVMPAAASNAAAINPLVNRLIALSFSMQTPDPVRRLTASASGLGCDRSPRPRSREPAPFPRHHALPRQQQRPKPGECVSVDSNQTTSGPWASDFSVGNFSNAQSETGG